MSPVMGGFPSPSRQVVCEDQDTLSYEGAKISPVKGQSSSPTQVGVVRIASSFDEFEDLELDGDATAPFPVPDLGPSTSRGRSSDTSSSSSSDNSNSSSDNGGTGSESVSGCSSGAVETKKKSPVCEREVEVIGGSVAPHPMAKSPTGGKDKVDVVPKGIRKTKLLVDERRLVYEFMSIFVDLSPRVTAEGTEDLGLDSGGYYDDFLSKSRCLF